MYHPHEYSALDLDTGEREEIQIIQGKFAFRNGTNYIPKLPRGQIIP